MSTLRKGPPLLEKARDMTASFEGGFKSDDDDDDDHPVSKDERDNTNNTNP